MKFKADDLELVAIVLLIIGVICSVFCLNLISECLGQAAFAILIYISIINIKNKISRIRDRAKNKVKHS